MRNRHDDPVDRSEAVILVRGAGELASGVGWVLTKAGFRVLMTETAHPLMVRWPVCFGSAVLEGSWKVEDVVARRIEAPAMSDQVWEAGEIPVLVDPELVYLAKIKPSVLVDGIMAKRNLGTQREMAPLTFGLGPGFTAGEDVDAVVETNRGHHLARVYYTGVAEPNTGTPGVIGGKTWERVVYAPATGIFHASRSIGELVGTGDVLGVIDSAAGQTNVVAPLDGVLRGLLRTGTPIAEKVKTGDVDPRADKEYCWTISEKARAIGAAVLMAIMESRVIKGK